MTTIRITGLKEAQAALIELGSDLKAEIDKAVNITAFELQKDLQKRISAPGTGTTYYRIYDEKTGFTSIFAGDSEGYVTSVYGRLNLSATHRASKAGEAPASDSGALLRSIYLNRVDGGTVVVGSKLLYAAWLEYGTRKIAPRPAWRPAALLAQTAFTQRLKEALARAAR